MAQPTWDITDDLSRENVERILAAIKKLDGVPPEALEVLGAYVARLANENENEQLGTEVERLKTGAKLPSQRRETLTVHVQHGEYQKSQPVILARWTCQECGKSHEREQLPGGIPKYCPPEPDGTPSPCQLKARARAVEKQRLKRQVQRQSQSADPIRDNISIINHKQELSVSAPAAPIPVQELIATDPAKFVRLWHELGGQSQQYLIEVGLSGKPGKIYRDGRRGREDRQRLWEKELVNYKARGANFMVLTLTDLGRNVLLVAPYPEARYQIPSRGDLARVRQILEAFQVQDLTPDELHQLDVFLFADETRNVLSWPRGGVAYKRDRQLLEALESRGLIRLLSRSRREVVYQLTEAGRTAQRAAQPQAPSLSRG